MRRAPSSREISMETQAFAGFGIWVPHALGRVGRRLRRDPGPNPTWQASSLVTRRWREVDSNC